MKKIRTVEEIERMGMFIYPAIEKKLKKLVEFFNTDKSGAVSILLENAISNESLLESLIEHYKTEYQIQIKNMIDKNERSIMNLSLNLTKGTKNKLKKLIEKKGIKVRSFSDFIRAIIDYEYNLKIAPNEPLINEIKMWFKKHKKNPKKIVMIDPGETGKSKIAIFFENWE